MPFNKYNIVEYFITQQLSRVNLNSIIILMQEITRKLSNIKGLGFRQLYLCKDFYMIYPNILQTVSAKLHEVDYKINTILRTLSAKLQPVPKYLVKLPDKKVFENFLKRELNK